MKKMIMILMMFMASACVPPYTPTYDHYLYIGDSNCDEKAQPNHFMAWMLAGIAGDCVSGLELMKLTSLPEKHTIFLALGVNDAKSPERITPEIFGEHLTFLLGTTSSRVFCVYPTLPEDSPYSTVLPYKQEMLLRCADVIDPEEFGVLSDSGDGIHWSAEDHAKFTPAIVERF